MVDLAAFAVSGSVGCWESAAAALEAEETRDVALAIGVESEDGITIRVCDELGGEGLEVDGKLDEKGVESVGGFDEWDFVERDVTLAVCADPDVKDDKVELGGAADVVVAKDAC